MKSKILVALGAAAVMVVATQSAGATEKRDTHKVTRHHLLTSAHARAEESDARARNAYDEWRPTVPAAAFDEAARYRGTTPTPAGH